MCFKIVVFCAIQSISLLYLKSNTNASGVHELFLFKLDFFNFLLNMKNIII